MSNHMQIISKWIASHDEQMIICKFNAHASIQLLSLILEIKQFKIPNGFIAKLRNTIWRNDIEKDLVLS